MADEGDVRAALFDFARLWREDKERGEVRTLVEYLARFPDHPDAVAEEYLRIQRETDSSARGPGIPGQAALDHRYTRLDDIARGGMGRILRVRDERLHRDLAMKVSLRGGRSANLRLEDEAQVTGWLDHPGVVPIHDTGKDADGLSFFTMKLVEGRDLREIIQLAHRGEEGWGLPRALEVLLKVCDTMAFAHARGIVHRDLKPSNVRVGQFGEVYVIDWGLAKIGGRPDGRDLRLRRRTAAGADIASGAEMQNDDSPLVTLEGDVIGTPCCMSPEQAMGRLGEVAQASDVYSVGAMLYEILSGRMPYIEPGERIDPAAVLARVVAGPPTRLLDLCPEAPPELVAICDKAMARDARDRYADMREMAADVRAYLELRVVRAYGGGRLTAVQKWVARNRGLSRSIAVTLIVAVCALAALVVAQRQNKRRLQLLADARAPADLAARAHDLRPSVPERVPEMRRWLGEARDVVSRKESYEQEFDALRARALSWNPGSAREKAAAQAKEQKLESLRRLLEFYRAEEQRMERDGGLSSEGQGLDYVQGKIAAFSLGAKNLQEAPVRRLTWEFSDPEDARRYAVLEVLLPQMLPLLDGPEGPGLVTLMQGRLDHALRVEADTLTGPADAWAAAIDSIADRAASPIYQGLKLHPQLGLIPLRRDPRSGLWEFAHLQSGEPPSIDVHGEYRIGAETGIVLVLIPPVEFDMGAQREDPSAPNFDPLAEPEEARRSASPSRTVRVVLAPFFISKYELTQAQWRRCSGRNPSEWSPTTRPDHVRSELHPVESVDWNASVQAMRTAGLDLPTEAQWECAARAGTSTPWWTGGDPLELVASANVRPGDGHETSSSAWVKSCHLPVGSFRPNAYGLYDTCGNVAEWCRDVGDTSYDNITEVLFETWERSIWGSGLRVARGGSSKQAAPSARSSARAFKGPEYSDPDTGLRPSREIER